MRLSVSCHCTNILILYAMIACMLLFHFKYPDIVCHDCLDAAFSL